MFVRLDTQGVAGGVDPHSASDGQHQPVRLPCLCLPTEDQFPVTDSRGHFLLFARNDKVPTLLHSSDEMQSLQLLSETPAFLNYHWISQPLADNSWRTIPDDILGEGFAHFIRALKQLDSAAYPHTPVNDLDYVDLCKALGVEIPPGITALPGHIGSAYTIGRGRAWLARLHFQVLDLLLFEHSSRTAPPPAQQGTVSSWGRAVRQILSKAYAWDKSIKDFNRRPQKSTEAVASTSKIPESMPAAKRVAKRQEELYKATVNSNIESAAAGLLWVLEFGSEFAPVFKGETLKLNMCSTDSAKNRYRDSSKPTELLDLRVGSVEQFLRPLSRVLSISPILVLGENLRNGFIDMDTESEIHNRLCCTRSNLAALPFVETCIYTTMRGLCSRDVSGGIVSHNDLELLTKKLPTKTLNDTLIFKRLIDWNYEQRQKLLESDVTLDQPSLPSVAMPSTSVFTTPGIFRFDIPDVDSDSSGPDLRPIARGLSKPPHSITSPLSFDLYLPTMELFDELPAEVQQKFLSDSQTNAAVRLAAHPNNSLSIPIESTSSEVNSDSVEKSEKSPPINTSRQPSPPLTTVGSDIQMIEATQELPRDGVPPVEESNSTDDRTKDPGSNANAEHITASQSVIQRRSTRFKVSSEQPKASELKSTTYIPPKRKASVQLVKPGKKSKPLEADSDDKIEADSDDKIEADSEDTTQSLSNIRVKRSVDSTVVLARNPDGSGDLSFEYLSHKDAELTEYRIISDVKQAMKTTTDEHLHCLSLEQWESMPIAERVKLWTDGYDIYVEGLSSGKAIVDMHGLRAEIVKNNAMDATVEVQVSSWLSVQGLRKFAGDNDGNADIDYTKSIMPTTMTEMLDEIEKPSGLVLNGLNLASGGHLVHTNPLIDTGFDLETKVYGKTNGVLGMPIEHLDYAEFYFDLVGGSHAFSVFHTDICKTRLFVMGPGLKLWFRQWEKDPNGQYNINDSRAFDYWEPDKVNIESHHCTVTVLKGGHGMLLQQPGRRHAVIGIDGISEGVAQPATLTRGGYFLCASRMRESISVFMHIIMQPHLLTNAEHVALWPVYVRVCMFWMHSTMDRAGDLSLLAGYVPDFESDGIRGWLDIIYLACLIVLKPCLDLREYNGTGIPDSEAEQIESVLAKYKIWREWMSSTFDGSNATGEISNLEADIFSPCLIHMAAMLHQYHKAVAATKPTADIFASYTPTKFVSRMRSALSSYDKQLPALLKKELDDSERGRFYKFEGPELRFTRKGSDQSI
ncbi:hypothetical protein R3P38DRAFT_3281102 [Favolaschia claudopus]|uniref:JmjC domain-containing protein n=1 Tax=Favolaschia claudopus TaxID=2862362 RepID=A0AAW0AFX4_9AGAR